MNRIKLLASTLTIVTVIGGSTYYLMDWRAENTPLSGENYSAEELNEGGDADIGELSLSEAQKRINYLILDVRDTVNLNHRFQNLKLEITSVENAKTEEQKELRYDPLFVPLPTEEVKQALAQLKSSLTFQQLYFDNQSGIRLNVEPLQEVFKRAATPEQYVQEHYQVKTLYWHDGTQLPFNDVGTPITSTEDRSQDSTEVELKLNKPLEHVDLAVTYRSYPGFKKIVLDKDHSKVTFGGGEYYQLTALGGSEASLTLATPKGTTYVIQGMSHDGKALYNNGSNSNSVISPTQVANLRTYYAELLRIRRNFTEFKTPRALQEHLTMFTKNLSPIPETLAYSSASYRFDATPASVVIYVLQAPQKQTVELQMANAESTQERYIAFDNKTDKSGFIDKNGLWVVAPRFERIDYTEVPGVYRMVVGYINDGDRDGWRQSITKYFTFASGTNTLKQLPFDGIEQQINDSMIVVQQHTNGPYGVYDIKKQQIVVPMQYVNPEVVGTLFIARPGTKTYRIDSNYGIWSLSGKELLAPRYGSISASDGFIYTTSTDELQRDVYDLSLNKINPPGFTALGKFANDQPLLVQNRKSHKYAFIDTQGKALAISLPYDEVQSFSNGMAVIKKGELYGAIDLAGKVRVPPTYKTLHSFQKNLAAAEIEGGEGMELTDEGRVVESKLDYGLVLIDKDNVVVKKLGRLRSYAIGSDSNEASYQVWDAEEENRVNVFDADGKQTGSYVPNEN